MSEDPAEIVECEGLLAELRQLLSTADFPAAEPDVFGMGVYLLDHLPNLIGALEILHEYLTEP